MIWPTAARFLMSLSWSVNEVYVTAQSLSRINNPTAVVEVYIKADHSQFFSFFSQFFLVHHINYIAHTALINNEHLLFLLNVLTSAMQTA